MPKQQRFNLEQRLNALREHFVRLDGTGLNTGNMLEFRNIVSFLNSNGFIVLLDEASNRLRVSRHKKRIG